MNNYAKRCNLSHSYVHMYMYICRYRDKVYKHTLSLSEQDKHFADMYVCVYNYFQEINIFYICIIHIHTYIHVCIHLLLVLDKIEVVPVIVSYIRQYSI